MWVGFRAKKCFPLLYIPKSNRQTHIVRTIGCLQKKFFLSFAHREPGEKGNWECMCISFKRIPPSCGWEEVSKL
jgi:hypothetical protein